MGKDLVGWSRRDNAHIEQNCPIKILRYGGKVMVHDEDSLTPLLQFFEQFDDGTLRRGINCGERFVHEINICILHERASEKGSLLLPSRELADLTMRVVGKPNTFKRLHRKRL